MPGWEAGLLLQEACAALSRGVHWVEHFALLPRCLQPLCGYVMTAYRHGSLANYLRRTCDR